MLQKNALIGAVLVLFGLQCIAQDSAYYYTAFNSKDDSLKSKLHLIINNHVEFPYTSSSTDVWDILKVTDKDSTNASNVILFYSNRSVDGAQEYNSGSGWNREHVWAKSRGDFGTSNGAGTDVHHLRACDISVNSTRNNRNFEDCVTCIDVVDNGFNTGSKRDANLWTFEPPTNVKGDVARMIFYMTVRYEGDGNEPDLELTDVLQSNTSKLPLHATLTTLLQWNRQDPVTNAERNRNLIIYNDYQGNKNPFIDYPELAEYIWGDSTGVVWKPASTVSIHENQLARYTVYPNPSHGMINVNSLTVPNQVAVINSMGQVVLRFTPNACQFEIDLSNNASGLYILEMNFGGVIKRAKLTLTQ